MIPLADDGPPLRSFPLVTVTLMVLNVAAFVFTLGSVETRTFRFALVPANLTNLEPVKMVRIAGIGYRGRQPVTTVNETQIVPAAMTADEAERRLLGASRGLVTRWQVNLSEIRPALPAWMTLLTSMFLHGGLAHLFGNMVFLFAFGRRLEDGLGRGRYLLFYLATGILAGLGHVAADPRGIIPTVGASGAISGLLGGYLLLWPRRRILTFVPFWPIVFTWMIPVIVFVLIWVFMQILILRNPTSNVAVWAHLVGFLYGLVLVRFFDGPTRRRRYPTSVGTDARPAYGVRGFPESRDDWRDRGLR